MHGLLETTLAPSERLRCIDCREPLPPLRKEGIACLACGRSYAVEHGVIQAMGELRRKNRIAAEFYNGPRFERFRFWENLFLRYAGGLQGARRQILRHLPPLEGGSLLEVGVGDGDNLPLLSALTAVTGIDIAPRRLTACRLRFADRPLLLALAEAERIPFEDRTFDAVLCVGGFNFFSDLRAALAEMARVTRPGGRVVVADEIPDFLRYGWGHRIRLPALDRWLMGRWFGPEFRDMVVRNELDVETLSTLGEGALAESHIHPI